MATLTRKRRFNPKRKQQQAEALTRAVTGVSVANYGAIYEGFMARGIPESDIHPRLNVLSFNAWKAVGRYVKKGEKGVPVVTWIDCERKEKGDNGETKKVPAKRCKTCYVFHVSQTSAYDQSPAPAIAGYLEYHPQN